MPDSLLAEALSGFCFLSSAFDCCDGGTRGHFPPEFSASEHSFSSSEHKAGRQATLRQTGRLLGPALVRSHEEDSSERRDMRGATLSRSVLSGCRGFVSLRSYPLSTFASSTMGDSN